MKTAAAVIICSLVGYFLGCLNPAFLLARKRGFDIRERGSGNAGASNALITMSKKAGVLIALFDIFKAFAAVKISAALFPLPDYCGILSGCCCIAGHIFPVFMKFRGGKGLAALGGIILAFNPAVFLIMLLSEAAIALITDYICFVPITAAAAFPVIYFLISHCFAGTVILCFAAVIIEFKHTENLNRIRAGKEMHLSYIWRGSEEIDRISANDGKNT